LDRDFSKGEIPLGRGERDDDGDDDWVDCCPKTEREDDEGEENEEPRLV